MHNLENNSIMHVSRYYQQINIQDSLLNVKVNQGQDYFHCDEL